MSEPQNGRIGGGVLKDNLLRNGINLNFANTSSEIAANRPLLQLDVVNNRIGVNTEFPSNDLSVNGTLATTFLEDPAYANIATFEIQNSDINAFDSSGNINIQSASTIVASSISTDNINFNFNTISTNTPNTNLEIRPVGLGKLELYANTNITGSLHATGNINFGGNLTLGNDATDVVDFESDVNSDIIPDDNTRSLGSPTKKWKDLYSNLLNGLRVEVGSFAVSDTSLALRQGNIFYVSTLGDDTNVGDHQHGAFRTIEHALAVADSSTAGPVTIFVYPGEYEENLPLVVPENTTVTGENIRGVIIKPAAGSESKNVFELNQNTMVEHVTIADFFYDNLNDTGYAFSFAPGAIITDRSPYVKNVTVVTYGSTAGTDPLDPRGFASGDAGKGALIDGSVLHSSTVHPSMLFEKVTFITPGVDTLTMKNGVRVEWVNCFTYFSNRAIYATQGTLGLFSLGAKYGAELRSIGTSTSYGNYGAVADGANCVMYFVGHSFAYTGSGKDYSNDASLALQDQEIVELNGGKIYFVTTDHLGTFRVGNAFFADFEKGSTSIDANTVDFSGITAIYIATANSITYIDGERVDTGNIRFNGNVIETVDGDLIWSPTTKVFDVDTNNSIFILPRGTTSQRKNEESDIRFNTQLNAYEGFSSANVSFNGVYSDNRRTNINANNALGNIVLTANNIETGRVTATEFQLNGLETNNILANNKLITTTQNSDDLLLTPNGLGVTNIYNLKIDASVIEDSSGSVFSISNTGRGYVKIDTNRGFVIPVGNNSNYPGAVEAGMIRWNTERDFLEVHNGLNWIRASGEGANVDVTVMNEIMDLYTLVLG